MGVYLKKHFWKWFQQQSEIYRCLHKIHKKEVGYWMDELIVHLQAYCKHVYPSIWLADDGTMAKLIITAAGNHRYFRRVEEIVAKAPPVAGWEIVALYPPCPIDEGIAAQYGHTGIDPHNLWFLPVLSADDEPPGIIVYAAGYTTVDRAFEAAVEAVIVNLLGERAASLDLCGVSVDNLDELYPAERLDLMPLQELSAYLERVNVSSCFINERGELEEQTGKSNK